MSATSIPTLSKAQARRIWLKSQRLDEDAPFGAGPAAALAATDHLGYVQIDTIHVIERCHHHILFSRIPDYRRADLHRLQTVDKSVFEYWTHALSYIPTQNIRFFVRAMKKYWSLRSVWFSAVKPKDLRKVMKLIRKGPLSIRDIEDDVLVEKDHEWASRKPSKRALQLAFYRGIVTVSERIGIVKTYDLLTRHFGWDQLPKAASEPEIREYLLDRELRAQGVASVDSICYMDAGRKKVMRKIIDRRVRRGELVPVSIEGIESVPHWVRPATLNTPLEPLAPRVHILSPFDPLMRNRKRVEQFFGYTHVFEAYVPPKKRVFGYFALPVLVGDEIVAVLDLKTDRANQQLLLQRWTWITRRSRREYKRLIEAALDRFERFQLAR